MTREMQKAIKERKAEAALLVRYANPKSKSKPTAEQVLEVLKRHIPYCGTVRPIIKKFTVSKFNRNPIQRSARFIVELENGKKWNISVYENLKGRTPEEKEADKTATFPGGLFNIFHDEIKEPEQKEEKADTTKRYELTPTDGRKGGVTMSYDYREAVKDDVLEYIREEIDFTKFDTLEKLEEHLNDELWTIDSVTGNASGSYTFSSWEAEENICHNLDLLAEACDEFGTVDPLKQGAEACDVTIRCYLLGQAIAEALEEISDEFEKARKK